MRAAVTEAAVTGWGRRAAGAVALLSVWGAVSPAHAQTNPEAEPEKTEEAKPESVEPGSPGVPVEAATKAQKEDALKKYRLGVDLMGANKFDEALEMFRSSHAKVASPNSRLMVARALIKLKRFPEAYDQLQLVIAEATQLAKALSKYEQTVSAAQAELKSVNKQVGLLKLDVDGQVTVGDKPLDRTDWDKTLALAPGKVTVTLRLENGQLVEETVDVGAGQTTELTLDIPKPVAPEAPRAATPRPAPRGVPHQTLGWVGVGIGVVGFGSFAAFGLLNNNKFEDLEGQCSNNRCPSTLVEDAEDGRTYQTLANVGLGVGIAGTLMAAGFFIFGGNDGGSEDAVMLEKRANRDEAQGGIAGVLRQTQVQVGLGSIDVRGRF